MYNKEDFYWNNYYRIILKITRKNFFITLIDKKGRVCLFLSSGLLGYHNKNKKTKYFAYSAVVKRFIYILEIKYKGKFRVKSVSVIEDFLMQRKLTSIANYLRKCLRGKLRMHPKFYWYRIKKPHGCELRKKKLKRL